MGKHPSYSHIIMAILSALQIMTKYCFCMSGFYRCHLASIICFIWAGSTGQVFHKILKIGTPEIITPMVLKREQFGFTV